jgi:hypothetical protein
MDYEIIVRTVQQDDGTPMVNVYKRIELLNLLKSVGWEESTLEDLNLRLSPGVTISMTLTEETKAAGDMTSDLRVNYHCLTVPSSRRSKISTGKAKKNPA